MSQPTPVPVPHLVKRQPQSIPCGFGPRVLSSAHGGKPIYIGCEDGSVLRLDLTDVKPTPKLILHRHGGGDFGPIRGIACLDQLLLIATDTGLWRANPDAPDEAWLPIQLGDSGRRQLRGLFRVDGKTAYVSLDPFHNDFGQTVRVTANGGAPGEVSVGVDSVSHKTNKLGGARRVAKSEDRPIILGRDWERYTGAKPRRTVTPWRPGERPTILSDVGHIRDRAHNLEAWVLATDTGVYWLSSKGKAQRLGLPGLGLFAVSVTCWRDEKYLYLWATNIQGDSLLYWDAPDGAASAPDFRRSGLAEVGHHATVTLAAAASGSMFLVQLCRDDIVRVIPYERDPPVSYKAHDKEDPTRRQRIGSLIRSSEISAFRADHRSLVAREPQEPKLAEWPDYARLADWLEALALDRNTRPVVEEFLSSPSAKLFNAVTLRLIERADVLVAIRLWTLTLLGIANRMTPVDPTHYVGILRWLRELERPPSVPETVFAHRIETSIRFARRWGLYAEIHGVRANLDRPIEELTTNSETEPRLDVLAYRALRLERMSSLVAGSTAPATTGLQARDLSILKHGDIWLASVTWFRGGVETFAFTIPPLNAVDDSSPQSPVGLQSLKLIERQADRGEQYGHSRVCLLGTTGNRHFLLTAPSKSGGIAEQLSLNPYTLTGLEMTFERGIRLSDPANHSRALGTDEEVYRLLDLEDGWVLAGLKGATGTARIALLYIRLRNGKITKLELSDTFELLPSEESSADRRLRAISNRVGSLTLGENDGQNCEVFVGCEDGAVWQVEIALGEKPQIRTSKLIIPLASPISSMYCSTVQRGSKASGAAKDGPVQRTRRLIAGCRDGSIVAFQEFPDAPKNGETKPQFRWLSLWATWERGATTAVEPLNLAAGKPDHAEQLIVAATRDGRVLIADDRPEVEPLRPDNQRPRRPRFPGHRRGRLAFGSPCFAARLVGGQPYLLYATDDGRLELHTLQHLRQTTARKAEFKSLLDGFEKRAEVTEPGEETQAVPWLRLAEAAARTTQSLPYIPLRWYLDPSTVQKDLYVRPDWLVPRYLRPAVALRRVTLSNNPRQSDVGKHVRALLRNAWELRDVALYQQICELVLKRINFELYAFCIAFRDVVTGSHALLAKRLANIYVGSFDAINGTLELWRGSQDAATRTRIEVAKNLLDGDTFYALAHARETTASAKGNSARVIIGSLKKIVDKRASGVQQLLFKRDPLVEVEVFRAVNRALLRIAQRIVLDRSRDDTATLHWDSFEPFFQVFGQAAARTMTSRADLSDALHHEYARVFALCLLLCQSETVRITRQLIRLGIIQPEAPRMDFAARVRQQFEVLGVIGLTLPSHVDPLFRLLTEKFDPTTTSFSKELTKLTDDHKKKIFGNNRTDLVALATIHGVGAYFADLAKQLRDEPKSINLSALPRSHVFTRDSATPVAGKSAREFWQTALGRLRIDPAQLAAHQMSPIIRPELLSVSRELSSWAEESVQVLNTATADRRLFEPEASIFKGALVELQRAAGSFPTSAAVQQNLVVSMLGHHLLEELDLHVFELREIARCLDPDQASKSSTSKASIFGRYLTEQAKRAQAQPHSLRSLASVLESANAGRGQESNKNWRRVVEGWANDKGWRTEGIQSNGAGLVKEIGHQAQQLLRLALDELSDNHEKHTGTAYGTPFITFTGSHCSILFPLAQGASFERLESQFGKPSTEGVCTQGLCFQQPVEPRKGSSQPSSGMGLYIAALAVSMAGGSLVPHKFNGGARPWFSVQLVFSPPLDAIQIVGTEEDFLNDVKRQNAPLQSTARDSPDIVVIDDNPAFAMSVWREVADIPGFGSRRIVSETATQLLKSGRRTANGDQKVWWVEADDCWNASLQAVLGEQKHVTRGTRWIVDARTRVHGWPANCLKLLEEAGIEPEHCRVVSSYQRGGSVQGRQGGVQPKSPEVIAELAAVGTPSKKYSSSGESLHILVSGAGMELEEDGMAPDQSVLNGGAAVGVGWTASILTGVFNELEWIPVTQVPPYLAQTIYPLPELAVLNKFPERERWFKAGGSKDTSPPQNPDLDTYWQCLLEFVRGQASKDADQDLSLVMQKEEDRVRETFRRQFENADWGFLASARDAAALPFSSWLTTNYTRFADRAAGTPADGEPWRVVSTIDEADRLVSEVDHGPGTAPADNSRSHSRFLFKLHGDVSHLHTMAIAEQDKLFPGGSRRHLYSAAKTQILSAAKAGGIKRVVWHVVGHNLGDRMLLRLIQEVRELTHKKHLFVLINPREDHLTGMGTTIRAVSSLRRSKVIRLAWTGTRYLRTLRRFADLDAGIESTKGHWSS